MERKTISKHGKGRTAKPQVEEQAEASGNNKKNRQKEIDLLVCSNGNTVCCVEKPDGTIQLLGGKIAKDENQNSAAWRISQTKTGSGMFGIEKVKTIFFQDPGDNESPKIKVNIFVGETPINNVPKTDEKWVSVSALLNKADINGKTIRPLTKAVVFEMVEKGYLKTEAFEKKAKTESSLS